MPNQNKYGLPELYKFFRNKFTRHERSSEVFIDYKTFRDVLTEFNKELSKMLIEESIEFKMPTRLGSLRIRKYKKRIYFNKDGSIDTSHLSVNWYDTIELWKKEYPEKDRHQLKLIKNKPLVYHLNEHTEGYGFMLYWSKIGSNATNRSVYSIKLTRANDRYLAFVAKNNPSVNYYE